MRLLILGENSLIRLNYFSRIISHSFSIISSIYARQLAAVTPDKHTVKVPISNDDIDFDFKWDAVDIHFRTGTAARAYRVADEFKKRGTTVILSGSHPSALPDEAKTHADSVLIGNAEELWLQILDDLESDNLKPFYKSKGKVEQISFGKSNIDILSKAPIVGVLEATRGCPYKCDFCQDSNVLHGSIFRIRPLEDVIDEIKSFPQKFLFFCDVSLTIDPSYTKALFKAMKGLKKRFVCEGNADVLARDEELVRLSAEAGCTEWTVGFESFAQQAIDDIHKKTNTIEDYFKVVEKVHKYKMAILGNFMFGFDNDTPEVFDITKKHIVKLGLDSARFAILTPYPGTPFFNRLDKEGRILTKDWKYYNRKTVVYEPKNISSKQLQGGFLKITSEFNSLPNMIYRDFRALSLGFFPLINCISRNLESYLTKPKKYAYQIPNS